jgi:hypothetical protein
MVDVWTFGNEYVRREYKKHRLVRHAFVESRRQISVAEEDYLANYVRPETRDKETKTTKPLRQ